MVVTSPPYNLGKEYEKRIHIDQYVEQQRQVIRECVRALKPTVDCREVGNYVDNGTIIPLDAVLFPVFRQLGLQCRNRIVWHFEHGLHCSRPRIRQLTKNPTPDHGQARKRTIPERPETTLPLAEEAASIPVPF